VYVSLAEARAYARWRGGRLPTEAEFHRAAYGEPGGHERAFPWGDDEPRPEHGNFHFAYWSPAPVGWHPGGASAWGVHELVGNGWEWTENVFTPSPAFRAYIPSYPGYSADFFDGKHYSTQRGILGDRRPARPEELPELVPGALRARLRQVPLRPSVVGPPGAESARAPLRSCLSA
jgi:formylglycine-generating enzyme required for sulfatase activity